MFSVNNNANKFLPNFNEFIHTNLVSTKIAEYSLVFMFAVLKYIKEKLLGHRNILKFTLELTFEQIN